MSRKPAFVLVLAGLSSIGVLLAQTPARHPLTLDDIARLAEVRDPQFSPDGQSVAYVVSHDRREGRQEQVAHLDGRLRRQERSPDHLQPGQRVVAALES